MEENKDQEVTKDQVVNEKEKKEESKEKKQEVTKDQNDQNMTTRKSIAFRLLYSVLYVLIFEILVYAIYLSLLVQYIFLFATLKKCKPITKVSNQITSYIYKLLRYITLNNSDLQFPFKKFPKVIDPPDESEGL